MQYMLLIYSDESRFKAASKTEIDQALAAYGAYTEAMKKAGVIAGGDRLKPSASASTVRVANGKTKVLDGPYAETKEFLAGFGIIDVPNLDTALEWAARHPAAAYASVEVRPLLGSHFAVGDSKPPR